MTLILKLDLDMSRCTCIPKMKFLCQGVQKLEPEHTDRQTDRHDQKQYLPAYSGSNKNAFQ